MQHLDGHCILLWKKGYRTQVRKNKVSVISKQSTELPLSPPSQWSIWTRFCDTRRCRPWPPSSSRHLAPWCPVSYQFHVPEHKHKKKKKISFWRYDSFHEFYTPIHPPPPSPAPFFFLQHIPYPQIKWKEVGINLGIPLNITSQSTNIC